MILRCENLTTGYGEETVQSSLFLQAAKGEMICMLGKNGCGKSTLLRTIAGLQPALQGEIRVNDKELSAMSLQEKAKVLSLVLTERLSVEQTRIREVVAMGRYPYSSFLGG